MLLEQLPDCKIYLRGIVDLQQVFSQRSIDIHASVHGFTIFPRVSPQPTILPNVHSIRQVKREVGIEIVSFSGISDFHNQNHLIKSALSQGNTIMMAGSPKVKR